MKKYSVINIWRRYPWIMICIILLPILYIGLQNIDTSMMYLCFGIDMMLVFIQLLLIVKLKEISSEREKSIRIGIGFLLFFGLLIFRFLTKSY